MDFVWWLFPLSLIHHFHPLWPLKHPAPRDFCLGSYAHDYIKAWMHLLILQLCASSSAISLEHSCDVWVRWFPLASLFDSLLQSLIHTHSIEIVVSCSSDSKSPTNKMLICLWLLLLQCTYICNINWHIFYLIVPPSCSKPWNSFTHCIQMQFQ